MDLGNTYAKCDSLCPGAGACLPIGVVGKDIIFFEVLPLGIRMIHDGFIFSFSLFIDF